MDSLSPPVFVYTHERRRRVQRGSSAKKVLLAMTDAGASHLAGGDYYDVDGGDVVAAVAEVVVASVASVDQCEEIDEDLHRTAEWAYLEEEPAYSNSC